MEALETASPRLDQDGPVHHPFRPMPDAALDRSVFELFQSIAMEAPSAVAIRSRSAVVPYGELLDRATAIASRLLDEGKPSEPVALALPVDWQYIAAMLGCLAAGRPYVPLDLKHPAERLEWILEHSGASVALVDGSVQPFQGRPRCRVVDLSDVHSAGTRFMPAGEPGSVAYIIYTSGSTGRPKGVFQDQRGLTHDVLQYTNSIHLGRDDISTLLYSPSVNGAIRDIYGCLLNGASLCLGDLAGEGFAPVLERATRCGITLLHAMPPVLRSLLREPGAQAMLRQVRLAYVAGDRFLASDVRLLRSAMPEEAFLYTGIGSTECATLYRQWFVPHDWQLEASAVLPVGRAIPGREVRICSEEGEERATGETGIIQVRGRYLARGYWRDAALTQNCFTGPDEPGAYRVFNTGDLGRIRTDGLLEFVGRADRQVKIRGFRVDPTETEAALRALPGIEDAAVVVVEHQGMHRLVGCVQTPDARAWDEAAIQNRLQRQLPAHLVPSRVLVLSQFPRLPNFKQDGVALKRQAAALLEQPTVLAERAVERIDTGTPVREDALALEILQEWERVLKRSLPGTQTAWSLTGGDSLQALEILAAVERRTGRKLTTAMIQGNATPVSMAACVASAELSGDPHGSSQGKLPGKLWIISSLGSVSVHDRRLVELLAEDVDGDVLHITSTEEELERVRSIPELAEACAQTVMSNTEPGAPVYLMGLSFGGRVGFEMASILAGRGVPVRFVGIGDITVYPRWIRPERENPGAITTCRQEAFGVAQLVSKLRSAVGQAVIDGLGWLAMRRHQHVLRWYARVCRAAFGRRFIPHEGFAIRRGQAMGWNPTYLNAEVTLFVSADRGRALADRTPTFGWEKYAASVVRIDVPGAHGTYHRDEQAAGFAEAIRKRVISRDPIVTISSRRDDSR